MRNSSWITDVPDIRVIDIITDDPDGPFGAKEASEGSIVSSPPAVISALHNATGIWFKEQPVTPEKIVSALKKKGEWCQVLTPNSNEGWMICEALSK